MTKYASVKIITAAIAALTISGTAFAQNTVFKPLDNSLETQVCYTAAKEGRSAALELLKSKDVNTFSFEEQLTCNGLTLASFARKFNQKNETQTTEDFVTVKLVARSDDPASKICLDAVKLGYRAALQKHDLLSENVSCNNKSLEEFVETFENTTVVVQNSAE